MKRSQFIFLLLIASIFFPHFSQAMLSLPNNLSQTDRVTVLQIVGLGSSYKQLADPYPLGGYSGFEVGLSTEILSTEDISKLGSKTSTQSETTYYTFSFGKGLYNNLDVFVQFAPPGQSEKVTYFAGQLRWGFYQAEYLPVHVSLSANASSLNLQNLIITNTQGLDLITGFTVDDLNLYVGAGMLTSQGFFVGGSGGVVSGNDPLKESIRDNHFLAGISVKYAKSFLALQLDRYTQPVYSAKLGFRF